MLLTILADRSDYQIAIDEIRDEWLFKLLAFLNLDVSSWIQEGKDYPAIVDILFSDKVEIIDYPSSGILKVEVKNELIGEWSAPKLTLKENEKGDLYYEINIECWSIMEENIEISG